MFWTKIREFFLLVIPCRFDSFRICSLEIASKSFKYFIIQNQQHMTTATTKSATTLKWKKEERHWLNVLPIDSDEDWKDFWVCVSMCVWAAVCLIQFWFGNGSNVQCEHLVKSNVVPVKPIPKSVKITHRRFHCFYFSLSLRVCVCMWTFLFSSKNVLFTRRKACSSINNNTLTININKAICYSHCGPGVWRGFEVVAPTKFIRHIEICRSCWY